MLVFVILIEVQCVQSSIQQLYSLLEISNLCVGGWFFLLDVCHVDKSVAGMEYMNNPWSKDVYSASGSWEAIIQLQLFCHTPADCLEILEMLSRNSFFFWVIIHYA